MSMKSISLAIALGAACACVTCDGNGNGIPWEKEDAEICLNPPYVAWPGGDCDVNKDYPKSTVPVPIIIHVPPDVDGPSVDDPDGDVVNVDVAAPD